MYWAARSITGSAQGGLVAGAIYAFGPIQVNYAFHSQLLAAWWLPIAIGLSMRFVRTFESRWFALAVLMVWAQFATSVHLGVLAAVAVFVFAVPQVAYRVVRRRDWQLALKLLAIGSIVSAPFLPLVIGYRTYASIWAAERTLADVHPWSAQLSDYLSPSNRLPLHVGLRDAFATAGFERRLFPGFVPLALGAFGLVAAALPRLKIACNIQRTALAAAALAFVGVLLSLGPHWKWDDTSTSTPLPYWVLYENFDVLRAIRVVARFSLLVHVGLAVLAAVAVAWTERRIRGRLRWCGLVGAAASLLLITESFPSALPMHPVRQYPQLEEALSEVGSGPTLFLPVRRTDVDWRYGPGGEVERMWLAARTRSGPIVGGYSGYIWPRFRFFQAATTNRSPSEAHGLALGLQAYGIRNVVVAESMLLSADAEMWAEFLRSPAIERQVKVQDYIVVRLRDNPFAQSPAWGDLDTSLRANAIEPSRVVIAPLVLAGREGAAWVPPRSSHQRQFELLWHDQDGRIAAHHRAPVTPPVFIEAGGSVVIPLRVTSPSEPGEYRVEIRADSQPLTSKIILVEPTLAEPFRQSADGLHASLTQSATIPAQVVPGQRIPIRFDAINIGPVTWSEDANIRLGWEWYRSANDGDAGAPVLDGRIAMMSHVFGEIRPGQGYVFTGYITAPAESGTYSLRIGMLAELVAWFPGERLDLSIAVDPA